MESNAKLNELSLRELIEDELIDVEGGSLLAFGIGVAIGLLIAYLTNDG